MTLFDSAQLCVCGHGPWAHGLLAFRKVEGQLLRTSGICSHGACLCDTYEERGPRIVPQRKPRRFAPLQPDRNRET